MVTLFDNSGYQFRAAISRYHPESVAFDVLERQDNPVKLGREIWLFAAIVKKDTFEWIVEKATELGISHIVPILSARSEKKDLNVARITKVSIEAAEQSGRATVPKIHDILKLADAIATYSEQKAVAWEPSAPKFAKNNLLTIDSMYIGPEGGWTKEELELFEKKGIKAMSLGPQILRAETAVVAALAQIVF
jgi:16S rRNA (uracil1498-N3)-methyltransferase